MLLENANGAPTLTQRQAESIDRALAGVFEDWVLKLRRQLGESADDKLRIVEEDRRQKRDLLSLAPRLLRSGACPGDEDLNALVANVRRKEYSISDLFIQLCCLEEVMSESLDRSCAGGSQEACVLAEWIRGRFRGIFEKVLNETAIVYESFTETGRAFCQTDESGSIVYANEKMCRLLGVDRAEGLRLAEFFGADAADVSDAIGGKHGRKPLIRQLNITSRSHARACLHAEITPLFVEGRHRGAYATFSDMTSFADLQKKVFDQSPLGILRVNRDLEFTYVNPAILEMIGADTAEGLSIWQVVRDEDSRKTLIEQFSQRKEGKSNEYEIAIRRLDDNRVVPVSIAATPEYDNLGKMIGALSIIRNLELDRATAAFHRHIEACHDWEELLAAVAAEMTGIVPYDLLLVSVYTRDRQQARVILEYPEQDRIQWPKRWLPISPELLRLMDELAWEPVADLQTVLDRPEMEQFRGEKEVQLLVDRGIRSLIRIAVSRAEGALATVTLMSRRPNAFAGTVERLKVLPIADVVNTALYHRMMKEQQFRFELMKRISDSECAEDVMDAIVHSLAEHHGWPDVAVFRVDEVKRQFVLEAQAHSDAGVAYKDGLALSFEGGVLGEVYRSGEALNIGDVSKHPTYRRTREKTKSELCIPIHLRGRIRWLLNVEDQVENAFSVEDMEALQGVVQEAHSILEHIFGHFFLDEFIAKASEAIFVTDMEGRVIRSNEAAARMLGNSSAVKIVGRRFEEFVAREDRYVLECGANIPQSPCHLITAENHPVDVLLACEVHEEFGCRVFCAKDLSLMRRLEELEAIGDMFREIAIQTRTPLSMLFNWLRQLRDATGNTAQRDLLEKALRQLRKVDLTYERFVFCEAKEDAVPYNPVRVDLPKFLGVVMNELPRSDGERIVVEVGSRPAHLRGDLVQLTFVFQSILAYLLRFIPIDEKIRVSVAGTESGIETRITGFAPGRGREETSPTPEVLVEARTRMDIVWTESTIRRFIEQNHGGRYARRRVENDRVEFLVALPGVRGED